MNKTGTRIPDEETTDKDCEINTQKIGNYILNQSVDEAPDLREFDSQEYELYETAGMKIMFKDEKRYKGQNIIIFGSTWDTVIAAVQGKIYKIAAGYSGPSQNESHRISKKTLGYLKKQMGKYTSKNIERRLSTKIYMWDTAYGNVIFGYNHKRCYINILLTSKIIREYAKSETENVKNGGGMTHEQAIWLAKLAILGGILVGAFSFYRLRSAIQMKLFLCLIISAGIAWASTALIVLVFVLLSKVRAKTKR